MAIEDIVRRIEADAANEAASLLGEAEQDAARVRDEAKARAESEAARSLAHGEAAARRDAQSLVANARLASRDAMLAVRLQLAAEALAKAETAMLALPDAEYAAFIAKGVAASAEGGETLLLGESDADRLARALPPALAAAGAPALTIAGTVAEPTHGVLLQGDRVRVEVSPAQAVAERREELLGMADSVLFEMEV